MSLYEDERVYISKVRSGKSLTVWEELLLVRRFLIGECTPEEEQLLRELKKDETASLSVKAALAFCEKEDADREWREPSEDRIYAFERL